MANSKSYGCNQVLAKKTISITERPSRYPSPSSQSCVEVDPTGVCSDGVRRSVSLDLCIKHWL